ncbi:MAG: glycoside hydrolase family 9 protein [Promethearchaeota archaeon]
MKSFKSRNIDIKFSFIYIGVFIFLNFLMIATSFYLNYQAVHGRYDYTGAEVMSMFGLLDIAHYRPLASEEFMSWQFFFGNFHFFVIFSFLMAGFFHVFHPRIHSLTPNSNPPEAKPSREKMKKLGIFSMLGVATIIIAEFLFSIIGAPETGLGSRIFIKSYYRDIPSLLSGGFYVVNNLPDYPQLIFSILPVASGFGVYFYIHVLRSFKSRGLITSRLNGARSKAGFVFLISFFIYFLIMILKDDLVIQETCTGYTAYMSVFWILNAMLVTSIIVLIIRGFIPGAATKKKGFKPHLKAFFTSILLLVLLFNVFISFILPFLGKFGLGKSISPSITWMFQVESIAALVGVALIIIRKNKGKHFVIIRGTSLIFGLLITFFIFLLYSINPSASSIEISWMFNSIIPSAFIVFLTMGFYLLGFKIEKWIAVLGRVFLRQIKKLSTQKRKQVLAEKYLKTSVMIGVVILPALVPVSLGIKLFGEKPLIIINNVGVFPDQEKTFFISMMNPHQGLADFDIIDVNSKRVVYSGVLEYKGWLWGRYYWKGNFTSLMTPGEYYIKARVNQFHLRSYNFNINKDYLDDAFRTGLYWFYYARCGTRVVPIHDGVVGHEPCHLHDAYYLANESGNITLKHANLTGGWHDSGDYNVYGSRVAPCSYSLVYAFDQAPAFFNQPAQRATYPENDSIPDIIEESWFGLKWWMKRFYEPEHLFFDSNELGEDGKIRWTVFCPPETEEFFGNGRYIVGDQAIGDTLEEKYYKQFIRSPSGLLVAASFAAMARICEDFNYYPENITQLKILANETMEAYSPWIGNNFESIVAGQEMFKLTGNDSYFHSAASIVDNIIVQSANLSTFPTDFRALAFALRFAKEFNGTLNWNGLDHVLGNHTIDNFAKILQERTEDDKNFFNFLRYWKNGPPVIWNSDYMKAILASAYAFNITGNASLQEIFHDFITRHLDWIFGRNMENTCLMESLKGGDKFRYGYFTRQKYIPGNLRGAYPGSFADGFQYFPGDYSSDTNSNLNNSLSRAYPMAPITNIYGETWSDNSYAFMLACGALFSQVLGKE